MNLKQFLPPILIFISTIGILRELDYKSEIGVQPPISYPSAPIPDSPAPLPFVQISNPSPAYQDYPVICSQIKEWENEAGHLVETGVYGKSAGGLDLYYIRLTNEWYGAAKEKVLITACIHGNEPLSTAVAMRYIGNILGSYEKNESIRDLLDKKEVYFIPVVSPDSYPHSRHVEGVDPNRNFPTDREPDRNSVRAVTELRKFFLNHKFKTVASCHTWGRVFLMPYGDRTSLCPDNALYLSLLGRMTDLCGYRVIRACEMYGKPIFGTEVDWYYRNGAKYSVVMEMGTHQRIPSEADIRYEFDKTFGAILIYMAEICG